MEWPPKPFLEFWSANKIICIIAHGRDIVWTWPLYQWSVQTGKFQFIRFIGCCSNKIDALQQNQSWLHTHF